MRETVKDARRPAGPPLPHVLCLLLALAGAACGDDLTGPRDPEDVTFAPELEVELSEMTRLPSGVYIQTLTEGEDPAVAAGDSIIIEFRFWLSDGRLVQASDSVGFRATQGNLIQGFYEGMLGQETGEVRKIVIPSELGYGSNPNAPVPPNSVLVFDVRLRRIVEED